MSSISKQSDLAHTARSRAQQKDTLADRVRRGTAVPAKGRCRTGAPTERCTQAGLSDAPCPDQMRRAVTTPQPGNSVRTLHFAHQTQPGLGGLSGTFIGRGCQVTNAAAHGPGQRNQQAERLHTVQGPAPVEFGRDLLPRPISRDLSSGPQTARADDARAAREGAHGRSSVSCFRTRYTRAAPPSTTFDEWKDTESRRPGPHLRPFRCSRTRALKSTICRFHSS